MLNDPYIEVINKTRSLGLEERLTEDAINVYLKEGAKKLLAFLQEKNVPDDKAAALLQMIKKEFKATYRINAIYTGVFMLLFFFLATIFFMFSQTIGFWMIFFFIVFIWFLYLFIKNLSRALAIK